MNANNTYKEQLGQIGDEWWQLPPSSPEGVEIIQGAQAYDNALATYKGAVLFSFIWLGVICGVSVGLIVGTIQLKDKKREL